MKAFIAFVVILILALGGLGGYFGWTKMNKVDDWGLGLSLGSELKEGEKERVEKRYNQILDRDDVLMNAVKAHNLSDYYGVSNDEEALVKFKEDTFVRLHDNKTMHILFTGKRSSRKKREAAIRTVSEDFLNLVQEMKGM